MKEMTTEESRERLSNIIVGIVLAVLCVALIAGYVIRTQVKEVKTGAGTVSAASAGFAEKTLFDNVRIGGVDVSGLTPEEAESRVRAYLDEVLDTEFSLRVAQDHEVKTTLRELSAYWVNDTAIADVMAMRDGKDAVARYTLTKDIEKEGLDLPLEVSMDKEVLMTWLQENCSIYDVEMTGSELVTEGGVKKVRLGTPSQMLNLAESAVILQEQGFASISSGETMLRLPLEEYYPPGTPEGYEDYPGIEELVLQAENERAEAEAAAADPDAGTP